MKTSTFLLTFCAIAVTSALGGEMRKMLHAKAEECIEKTGADPNVLKKLKAGEDAVIDDKIKCFSACLMKAVGMMSEDGTVDVEVAKASVPSDVPHREKILAAIEACANEKGENECETGHAIAICMHKNHMGDMAHPE